MRFDQSGCVSENFFVVGPAGMPVYLLDGEKPALFDSGNSPLNRRYVKEINEILGGRSPVYLFLTHSHFDHVGSAGYFKKAWPDLTIASSDRVRKVLARPGALEVIAALNKEVFGVMTQWGLEMVHEDPFRPFEPDLVLESGQTVDLGGGLTVQPLETPGHTWDFLSYWIREKKLLIASEAAGCEDASGEINTEFLVDYDEYLKSLDRLTRLEPEILCQGHHLVYTGSDCGPRLAGAREAAETYLKLVEDCLQASHGDPDRAALLVKAREYDPKPWPKQPEAAYLLNTRARIKTIRERMTAAGRMP